MSDPQHNPARRKTRTAQPRVAVSIPEAAEMLSLSVNSVWRLLRTGDLHRLRVGRRSLVSVDELRAFLKRLQQAS